MKSMSADCNIIQRLKKAAPNDSCRAALVQAASGAGQGQHPPDEAISFADLAERSAGYARFFLSQGLTPKDRALLLMPPGIGFYTLFLALATLAFELWQKHQASRPGAAPHTAAKPNAKHHARNRWSGRPRR